jgi:hypothetical protein
LDALDAHLPPVQQRVQQVQQVPNNYLGCFRVQFMLDWIPEQSGLRLAKQPQEPRHWLRV